MKMKSNKKPLNGRNKIEVNSLKYQDCYAPLPHILMIYIFFLRIIFDDIYFDDI